MPSTDDGNATKHSKRYIFNMFMALIAAELVGLYDAGSEDIKSLKMNKTYYIHGISNILEN